jgi:hypothetical protein
MTRLLPHREGHKWCRRCAIGLTDPLESAVAGAGAHEELEAQVQALMQTGLAAVLGSKRSRRLTVADANAEAKLEPYIKACAAAADEKVRPSFCRPTLTLVAYPASRPPAQAPSLLDGRGENA